MGKEKTEGDERRTVSFCLDISCTRTVCMFTCFLVRLLQNCILIMKKFALEGKFGVLWSKSLLKTSSSLDHVAQCLVHF